MLKKIQPVIKTNISVTQDEYSAIINMRVFIIKITRECGDWTVVEMLNFFPFSVEVCVTTNPEGRMTTITNRPLD